MKKLIALVLTIAVGCSALAGCGTFTKNTKNQDGIYINKEINNEKMKTITGKEVVFQDNELLLGSEEYGYAAAKPEAWKDISDDQITVENKGNGSYIGYVPQAAVDELLNTDTKSLNADEHIALYDRYYAQIIPIACIYAENDDKKSDKDYGIPQNYEKTEKIAEYNGTTYYLTYNQSTPSDTTLNEEEKPKLDSIFNSVLDLKENILLFPAGTIDDTSSFQGSLTSFEAEDMDGKKIDQSIFADYDLTMVNIWTTWCGVCVEEMPYLEKLHKQLPKNVNIISICSDAKEEKDLAQQILEKNDITFKTLIGNDSLQDSILKYISGFPTTVFVDKEGKIVGDIQMGAPGENIVDGYQKLIDNRLAEVTQ